MSAISSTDAETHSQKLSEEITSSSSAFVHISTTTPRSVREDFLSTSSMASDSKRLGTSVSNHDEISDSECTNVLPQPICLSGESISDDIEIKKTDGESVINELSESHRPPFKTTAPLLENTPTNLTKNDEFLINLDTNSDSNSRNLNPFVRCLRSTKNNSIGVNESSCGAVCGPNPKKIICWLSIIVFIWITFIVVINMHKKVGNIPKPINHQIHIV